MQGEDKLRLRWSARSDHQPMCCFLLGSWVSCVPVAIFAVEQGVCVLGFGFFCFRHLEWTLQCIFLIGRCPQSL